jgi:hypothetical protein
MLLDRKIILLNAHDVPKLVMTRAGVGATVTHAESNQRPAISWWKSARTRAEYTASLNYIEIISFTSRHELSPEYVPTLGSMQASE